MVFDDTGGTVQRIPEPLVVDVVKLHLGLSNSWGVMQKGGCQVKHIAYHAPTVFSIKSLP